jgi:group II intron reverse transcriptase/maturase
VKEVPTGERQEMNGRSKECSDVSYRRNVGLPTAGDGQGNGAAILVSERNKPFTRRRAAGNSIEKNREVLAMRNAETVLAIIQERGKQGLPLEDIYRQLYNPTLYLRAYAKLYPNDGAMTPGSTTETADGMSMQKIEHLIDDIRHERYRWTPVRRVYIPKKTGKLRPLGLPTWRDKLLQEVIRSILEAYYEPQMSEHSHGFRPERGCHTALREIQANWTGTRWFIETDISKYFDTINHDLLLEILGEKLHDNRFLHLIRHLLQSGYLEEWRFHHTMSGAPQGGVVSPTLANIYLDRLDRYVETMLIPAYTRGERRAENPVYKRLRDNVAYRKRTGKREEYKQMRKQMLKLPSTDPHDPEYRRLFYVRYADDTLLGFAGPRQEAEEIKQKLGQFLQETLKLEMSEEKTLITQASTQAARFLGYEIVNQQNDSKHARKQRSANGKIGLRVPTDVVAKKSAQYLRNRKPIHRPERLQDTDYSIVMQYQQEYRGIVQYYLLAQNVAHLYRLHWVMKGSLLKTLANKHKSSATAMARKYQTTVQAPNGTPLKCLRVVVEREGKKPLVAQFGGIQLIPQPKATILDQLPKPMNTGTEILQRMLANTCELCKSTKDIEVHHIRKLADLKGKGGRERPAWVKLMAARQRKTLVVCRTCHVKIHAGQPL